MNKIYPLKNATLLPDTKSSDAGVRRAPFVRIELMPTTLYAFTIPLLTRGLSVLSNYTDTASAFAAERGGDPAGLLDARLAPDMFPLAGQMRSASDKAKNGVGRLIGVKPPVHEDGETTFATLKARIAQTLAFIGAVTPEQFEGADERMVELRFGPMTRTMTGHVYLTQMLLPDFFFHVATAHGILRHNDVQIGKLDYLGLRD